MTVIINYYYTIITTNIYFISCYRNLQNPFGLSYVMNCVKGLTTMDLEVRK